MKVGEVGEVGEVGVVGKVGVVGVGGEGGEVGVRERERRGGVIKVLALSALRGGGSSTFRGSRFGSGWISIDCIVWPPRRGVF